MDILFFPLLYQGYKIRKKVDCSEDEITGIRFGLRSPKIGERSTIIFGEPIHFVEVNHSIESQ